MNGYTKLFSTILTSTIWQEPIEVKVLWITMLALSDKNGYVSGSIPGLAHVAGISVEDCQKAIESLTAPDRFSRTKVEDGRRIRETDGGWDLVNHAKYRVLLSVEERKEYNRRKQQEHRERERVANVKTASNLSANVKQCQQKPDIAEADAEPEPSNPTELPFEDVSTPPQITITKKIIDDFEWLQSLKANPTYVGIDVINEHGKAKVWCDTHRRKCSRAFFVNWLNRIEKPMGAITDPDRPDVAKILKYTI